MKGNIDIEVHTSRLRFEDIPPTNAFDRRSYILKHQYEIEIGYPQYGVFDPNLESSIDKNSLDYKSIVL